MKKIIGVLLVLCLLATFMPVSVRAAGVVASGKWGQTGSDVKWVLDTNGLMRIYGTGAMTDCYIVNHNTIPVDRFRGWDKYIDDIKSVVIEEGITYIGEESFCHAANLKTVTIPDSVTQIGRQAFTNCDSLTTINFGKGLVKVGIEVFLDCDRLTEFRFPNSNTEYGNHLLAKCDNLKRVVFSKKMTKIGGSMFEGCKNLESITIPDNITFIGGSAFESCSSLTKIVIPESVTRIESNAFAFCPKLAEVSLPSTLTSMGNTVFSNCQSLTSITVPVNVSKLAHTFQHAYNLNSIKFLGNFPLCGSSLFGGVTATVYYPSNNKTWTKDVMTDYGGNITWVSYESSIVPSGIVASGKCGANLTWKLTDEYTLIISGTGDMDNYANIAPWADYEARIKNIILEPGVSRIDDYAFRNCRSVESVVIPDTVTQIGSSAFYNCEKLKEVTIPSSVTDIDPNAFSGCSGIKNIYFSGNAPKIRYNSFDGVSANAHYPDGNKTWTDNNRKDYGGNLTWVAYSKIPKPSKIVNVVSGVHVYWNKIPGVAKYGLWRSETGKDGTYKWVANPTVPHFTDTKTESGKTYYYKVTTMDANGKHSDKSDAIGITYVSTPDISARYNKAAGVKLEWKKVTGATGYAIYRKSYSGSDAWVRVATISGNSTFTWTDTSVKNNNGTAYKYTIRALAGSNMKTLSGCRNTGRSMVRLTSRTLTSAAKASATSIKCSWNTSSAVTGYEVRFMVGDQVYKTFTVGNYKIGTKTFTGLEAGQTYTIQVRSYKKIDGMCFYSAWSEAKTVTL